MISFMCVYIYTIYMQVYVFWHLVQSVCSSFPDSLAGMQHKRAGACEEKIRHPRIVFSALEVLLLQELVSGGSLSGGG